MSTLRVMSYQTALALEAEVHALRARETNLRAAIDRLRDERDDLRREVARLQRSENVETVMRLRRLNQNARKSLSLARAQKEKWKLHALLLEEQLHPKPTHEEQLAKRRMHD